MNVSVCNRKLYFAALLSNSIYWRLGKELGWHYNSCYEGGQEGERGIKRGILVIWEDDDIVL